MEEKLYCDSTHLMPPSCSGELAQNVEQTDLAVVNSDSESLNSISFVFDSTSSQKSTPTTNEFLGESFEERGIKSRFDEPASCASTGNCYDLSESPNFSPYYAASYSVDYSAATDDINEHPENVTRSDKAGRTKQDIHRKKAIVVRRSTVPGSSGHSERTKTSSERFCSWMSGGTSDPIFEESESDLDLEQLSESNASKHIHSTPNSQMYPSKIQQISNKHEPLQVPQVYLSSPGSSSSNSLYDTPRGALIPVIRKTTPVSGYAGTTSARKNKPKVTFRNQLNVSFGSRQLASLESAEEHSEENKIFRENTLKVSFGSRQLASLELAEEHSGKKPIAKGILHSGQTPFKLADKQTEWVKDEGILNTELKGDGPLVCNKGSVESTPQASVVKFENIINSNILAKRRLSSSHSVSRVKQICSWDGAEDGSPYMRTFDTLKDVSGSRWSGEPKPDSMEKENKNLQRNGLVEKNDDIDACKDLFRDIVRNENTACNGGAHSTANPVHSQSFPCIARYKTMQGKEIHKSISAPKSSYSDQDFTSEFSYLQHIRKYGKMSPVIENILEKYRIDLNQFNKYVASDTTVLDDDYGLNRSTNNNKDSQHLTDKDEGKNTDDAPPPSNACKKSSRKFSFFRKNVIVERTKSAGPTNRALKHGKKCDTSAAVNEEMSGAVDDSMLGATGGQEQHTFNSAASGLIRDHQHDFKATDDEYEPGVVEEFEAPKRKTSFRAKLKGFRFKSDRRNENSFSPDDFSADETLGRRSRSLNKAACRDLDRETISPLVVKTVRQKNTYDDETNEECVVRTKASLGKLAVDRYLHDSYKAMESSRSAGEIRPQQKETSPHCQTDDWNDDRRRSSTEIKNRQEELVLQDKSSHSVVIPLCSKTKIHFEDTVYYYLSPQEDDEQQGALVSVSEGKVLKHGEGSEVNLVAKEVSSQMTSKPLHRQKSLLHRMKAFFGRSSSSKEDAVENPTYHESFGDKVFQTGTKSDSELVPEDREIGSDYGAVCAGSETVDSVQKKEFGDSRSVVEECKNVNESSQTE